VAALTITPATGNSANYGGVSNNTSTTARFVVKNTGSAASTAVTLGITAGTPFTLVTPASGDCVSKSTTLASGASCTVQVQFLPTTRGAATATLSAYTGSFNLVWLTGGCVDNDVLAAGASCDIQVKALPPGSGGAMNGVLEASFWVTVLAAAHCRRDAHGEWCVQLAVDPSRASLASLRCKAIDRRKIGEETRIRKGKILFQFSEPRSLIEFRDRVSGSQCREAEVPC
jgi:hypothetical protein